MKDYLNCRISNLNFNFLSYRLSTEGNVWVIELKSITEPFFYNFAYYKYPEFFKLQKV